MKQINAGQLSTMYETNEVKKSGYNVEIDILTKNKQKMTKITKNTNTQDNQVGNTTDNDAQNSE